MKRVRAARGRAQQGAERRADLDAGIERLLLTTRVGNEMNPFQRGKVGRGSFHFLQKKRCFAGLS